ncbi:MAG: type I 3-dehydroquinate dehydratase, partial [Phycisphaerae bacterium]|nr:type I 3-dehydroquinate dehydratase [Phycisphaerae bacterium]
MTRLAVPICAATLDDAADAMRRAERGGADLLELRLDLLPAQAAEKLTPLAKAPVLATCRSRDEGGEADGGDAARAERLRTAVHAGAAYVDFEWAAWNRSPESRRVLADVLAPPAGVGRAKLVLSAHDFTGRPSELMTLAQALWASPAAVAKIAYRANGIADVFDALDILHTGAASKPTIALAMGEAGVISRLLARVLGAFCTFAALETGRSTAPGQPTLEQIKTLYRWDRTDAQTELFGVIGYPIAHSMSPAIHNAAFDATDYHGLYVPLLVEPESAAFDALLDGLMARHRWLRFRGLSVTIPHKENALRYTRAHGGAVEPLAGRIGAVNTIRFEADDTLTGRNTDYAAAIDAVCAALACRRSDLQ